MARGLHLAPSPAVFLLAISLTNCNHATKPSASPAPTQLHTVSAQVASQDSKKHIVLPNPALLGCKTGNCAQVLPDEDAGPNATYPWQVLVDFTDGKVIGLIAFYDRPTTIEDVQAAVDELYGKWAVADFRTGPARMWRVEPPQKFVIQLSVAGSGMAQLIYLTYGPKHPASDQAEEYQACVMEKAAKCAVHRR
jgi:hypothetical protein